MSAFPDVTGKLFPGDNKNKQIWQIIKPGLYIFCQWDSSPFFFPVSFLLCFMLYLITLRLCSGRCFGARWSSLLGRGCQRWSPSSKMTELGCTLNLNLTIKFYVDGSLPSVRGFINIWVWGSLYQLVNKGLIKPKLGVLTTHCWRLW